MNSIVAQNNKEDLIRQMFAPMMEQLSHLQELAFHNTLQNDNRAAAIPAIEKKIIERGERLEHALNQRKAIVRQSQGGDGGVFFPQQMEIQMQVDVPEPEEPEGSEEQAEARGSKRQQQPFLVESAKERSPNKKAKFPDSQSSTKMNTDTYGSAGGCEDTATELMTETESIVSGVESRASNTSNNTANDMQDSSPEQQDVEGGEEHIEKGTRNLGQQQRERYNDGEVSWGSK